MTAYGIFGDVDASPKLVRAALSDLLEAHRRTTPDDDFWLKIGVRDSDLKIYDEILDWAVRNSVYHEIVTPTSGYVPYTEAAKITVTPAFMLNVVDAMRSAPGGKILALVGDQTPETDVLSALVKAKDNGTEIRDLAEAGLTLILFRGDDPPAEHSEEENDMADANEEVEASFAELGEYADDTSDEETAEQAQGLLVEASEEHGLDPDDYATWAELGIALQELADAAETETEPEEEPVEIDGQLLTRESLVGKEIAEIKALAKAAGIEGYTRMRREPLINALLGGGAESPPAQAASAPARKATGAAKKTADSTTSNGAVDPGGVGLTDADVERIAGAVVSKLAAVLSSS